ncbi:hypothetical protein J6590_036631 [Homalodisca vitripennis]|nr:hypothetical protein J6590_036631 [Homalodisca vitripennis]
MTITLDDPARDLRSGKYRSEMPLASNASLAHINDSLNIDYKLYVLGFQCGPPGRELSVTKMTTVRYLSKTVSRQYTPVCADTHHGD